MRKFVLVAALLACAASATAQMSLPGSFEVSETGAAVYTIPIAVPPGTAGLEPKLTLQYNSRAGNGLLGVGWTLGGLPSIVRCPKTIAQDGTRGGVNYDTNDRFCLEGERLIAITGTYGADGTEYRTEREGFSKIVSYGSAGTGPAWFKVWTKAGQVLEFGNTADSRIEAQGKSTARLWAVNKVSDTAGNYLAVTYAADNANGEYRPTRIDYTGNATAGVNPYASVRFVYESRIDAPPIYQAGSKIQTTVRLATVEAYINDTLVRDYRLTYDASDIRASRLSAVTACAGGDVCLPALQFVWQPAATGTFSARSDTNLPSSGYTSSGAYFYVDVNGDSCADAVFTFSSEIEVFRSNCNGTFAPRSVTVLSGSGWNSPGSFGYVDVNSDGCMDFTYTAGSELRAFLSKCDGTFATPYAVTQLSGSGWNDANYFRYVDVNGDGCVDFTYTAGSELRAFLSKCDGTFVTPHAVTQLSGSGWNDPSYFRYVDVNGDGCVDFTYTAGSELRAFLSKCDGTFAIPYAVTQLGGSGWNDPNSFRYAGVTGGGLADFVFLSSSSITVFPAAGSADHRVASLDVSFGSATELTYKGLSQPGSPYSKDAGALACTYPCVDVQGPVYVVSEVQSSNGIGGTYRTTYRYAGAKADQQGRGFLGFRQVIAKDEQTLVEQATEYLQSWPFVGLTAKRTKTLGTVELNRTENTYASDDLGSGRRFVKLMQSVESSKELNGTALPTVTTSYQYDTYGNATQVAVSTGDGHNKTTVNTYVNDLTNWLLGRLTRAEVTSVTP